MDSRRFHIAVRRLADGFLYGVDRSPYLGSGLEYMQSRPYQYGDSVRLIDWRVTARTGRIHVKEYEAPKRMPCYLLLDTSASMALGSTKLTKYSLAIQVGGGLALACLDRAMPVGVLGVGEGDVRIEPSLARDRVLEWVHRLRKFRYDERTWLGRRISELGRRLSSRALVIVLSDLHDETALPALRLLGQEHDVVTIQFRDPAERGLAGAGVLLAREAETGRTFVTRGARVRLDQESIDRDLKRARIDHFVVDTDQPFAHRLRNFFRARDVLGRGVR
ncbi:MAG: DUF58 domain-containing protein [Planctomycetes bacterium]|nr:DUF58 domain-containing protein [Planctomycetota bacterium]